MKAKLYAMYLPQYHEIEENNLFWGKGFTDWNSVKKSEPLYKNHIQPKIPLNDNYYDLSETEAVRWQAKVAKEYGVDGFGIYHYWFNDEKNILTKPAEIILDNKDIDIEYFYAWDNISWKRTWGKVKGNDWSPLNDNQKTASPILIQYDLGNEKNWEKHFNYLLPYFKDERYVKEDGKPIFMIYHYDEKIMEMNKYWDKLANQNGLPSVKIIYRFDKLLSIPESEATFRYEPAYSGWNSLTARVLNKLKNKLKIKKLTSFNYDKVWKKIIANSKKDNNKNYLSCFVNYDDTPRRGIKGRVIKGGTPEKFGKYFKELYDFASNNNTKYIFLTAWNEWAEGAYLEPDTNTKYEYLETIKKIKDGE